jgi:TQXA domain-containing protein
MIMSGTGPGQGVNGWIGPTGSLSDPTVEYPPDPTVLPGFTSHPEGFAGIILGSPTDGGAPLSLYCIDIQTLTYGGVGYNLGTWDASNVHNVGFVAYLLNNYVPNTAEPAGLADDNQRAAAVQAAIWYFSDNYVLTAGDPLRTAVAAIVEDARLNGPLVAPPPPNLQITPPTAQASAGGLAGPFTIASPVGPATVAATASMFSDAAGTVPLANGDSVTDGTSRSRS